MAQLSPKDFFKSIVADAEKAGMNLEELAARVGVSGVTLRSWIYRKAISREACAAVGRVLAWSDSPEDLAKRYGLTWARHRAFSTGAAILRTEPKAGDLLKQISIQDQKLKRLRVSDAVLRYAQAMKAGDFFAFTSADREPYETVPELHGEFATARVRAIANGACFLYIVPTGNKWLIGQVNKFREWVMEELVRTGEHTRPKARARVDTRLLLCTVEKCELWVPGFSFGFHQARDANSVCVQRASIRLPNDFASEINHSDSSGQLTSLILHVVCDTLETYASRSKKSERTVFDEFKALVRANESSSRHMTRPNS